MAWPATLAVTVVLVSTIWAHDAHFNESVTLGSNVTLPCYFEPRKAANNVISVLWKLNDCIPILFCKNISQCKDKRATWRGDLSVGNASIVITHLRPEDVGNYTCEIFCDSEGTRNKTTVQLTVQQGSQTIPPDVSESSFVSRHEKQGRNVVIGVCVASVLAIVAAGLAIRAKRRSNLARAGGGDVHPALMSQHPGGQPASVVHIHIFSGDGGVGGEN
ncbi:myelin protein P0-like isoform X1 [Lethenteron reissneri]|uniref:myelin protein P0-like isoform X1 n=1 Tax=Lethenteron reissneri TaxID=7753 RepID=UPI002AB6F112|nr:myelin protein P0-like isoform X1 [Lethenteron reissneri]XP_061403776.1 myelin protein P0-like isoform X1 [Lethenteron reissneri]XP_061403777.1 myelin protein P0-like isoform X1 [Lethenteron reissneri]